MQATAPPGSRYSPPNGGFIAHRSTDMSDCQCRQRDEGESSSCKLKFSFFPQTKAQWQNWQEAPFLSNDLIKISGRISSPQAWKGLLILFNGIRLEQHSRLLPRTNVTNGGGRKSVGHLQNSTIRSPVNWPDSGLNNSFGRSRRGGLVERPAS